MKLKKKYILQSMRHFLFICLFLNRAAFAADEKLPSLAAIVVDSVQVMNDSLAVKGAQEDIEKKRTEFQKEISAQEDTLRKENEKLLKEQSTLSAKDFEEKRKKFEQKIEKAKVLVDTRRHQLETAYNDVMKKINDVFMLIAQRIAEEKGANVVFQRAVVIWLKGDIGIDVTPEIIAALNKELPKVTVVFPSEKDLSKATSPTKKSL